jgi:hypothetical protein
MVRAVSRSRVAKWPDSGATSSTGGWVSPPVWALRKCSSVPKGADITVSCVTGTSSPATSAVVMP